jgi:hypothetical protein
MDHLIGADELNSQCDAPGLVQVVCVYRRDAEGKWQKSEELVFDLEAGPELPLRAAKGVVDDALSELQRTGMTAEELMSLYRNSGPDPYIYIEDRALAALGYPHSHWCLVYTSFPFNAWGYAEEACQRLCGSPVGEPSHSLAGWERRYDQCDLLRMKAQLFLGRKVRLIADIDVNGKLIPGGSIGKISCWLSEDKCDYSREVPIIFEPAPQSVWRRLTDFMICRRERPSTSLLTVPLRMLEFAESDAAFSSQLYEIYTEVLDGKG